MTVTNCMTFRKPHLTERKLQLWMFDALSKITSPQWWGQGCRQGTYCRVTHTTGVSRANPKIRNLAQSGIVYYSHSRKPVVHSASQAARTKAALAAGSGLWHWNSLAPSALISQAANGTAHAVPLQFTDRLLFFFKSTDVSLKSGSLREQLAQSCKQFQK